MTEASCKNAHAPLGAHRLAVIAMIATTSGCGAGVTADRAAPAQIDAKPAAIDYLCGSDRVALQPDGARAMLMADATRYELATARSASGARYADSKGTEFWTHGDEASFTREGEQQASCVRLDRLVGTWNTEIQGTSFTLTFGNDERLATYGGCNRMSGSWRVGTGADVTFGAMASTMMLCPNALASAERRLAALLSDQVLTLRFEDSDRVTLEGAGERIALVRGAVSAP